MNRKYLTAFIAGLCIFALMGATFKTLVLDESGDCAQSVNFTGTTQLAGAAIATQAYSDGLVSAHNVNASAHSSEFAAKQNTITASGLLKGAGAGSISAAVAGTDYVTPHTTMSGYGITDGVLSSSISVDTGLAEDSDSLIPSQKAVKYYVDNNGGAVTSVFGKTGAVANISDATGYLKNDGSGNFSYDNPSGSGDVTGPASSTDGNVVTFNGATGKIIKDSGLTLSGSNTGDEDTTSIKTKLGAATSTADGYLTSTDWSTFNGKVSGTIGNSSGNIVSRPGDNTVGADTISEISSGVGVTADGVLLKDNDVQADEVRTDNIIEKTATNGVAIEGVSVKDSFLEMTEIAAPDSPAADKLRVYAKDSSGTTKLYTKDSAGTETELGAGGGGGTWGSITGTLNDQTDLKNRVIDTSTSTLTADDNGKILYVSSAYPPVTDGGIAKWTLENVLTDSVGSYTLSNSGLTFSEDATFPLGSRYVAIANGSSSASFSDTGLPAGSSARSISVWVKTTTTSLLGIIGYGTHVQYQSFGLLVGGGPAGKLLFATHGNDLYSTSSINTGSWMHCAVTFDGTNIKLYVNGVLENSSTPTGVNTVLSIGRIADWTNPGMQFPGSISDVRIYNRALDAAELLSIYNGETGEAKYTPSTTKLSDLNFGVCQGRLTLESGVPVSTTDQTAKTTLYFTPYNGNKIATYDGTDWSVSSFTEKSLSLSGYTANKNYDIWIYDNAGTLTLDSTIWTDDTTRATALTTQDGIYVKTGDATRRYLGTIRTTATSGQCEDSAAKRFVWNYYNRSERSSTLFLTETWTYAAATWRSINNDDTKRLSVVTGLPLTITYNMSIFASKESGRYPVVAIGYDSTDAPDSEAIIAPISLAASTSSSLTKTMAAGYHYFQMLENSRDTITTTFYGERLEDDGLVQTIRSGISGKIKN